MNDLSPINSLMEYKQHNPKIASAALKGVQLHMWYLTEEFLPLCLSSSKVTDDIKHSISQRILQSEKGERCIRCEGTNFEKPVFPGISEESLELADYAGQDSWAFFRILGLKADFLHVPVAVWPSREENV